MSRMVKRLGLVTLLFSVCTTLWLSPGYAGPWEASREGRVTSVEELIEQKMQSIALHDVRTPPVVSADASALQSSEPDDVAFEEPPDRESSEDVAETADAGTRTTCTCGLVGDNMICDGAGTVTWTRAAIPSTCPADIVGYLEVRNGCHLNIEGCTLGIGDDMRTTGTGSTISIYRVYFNNPEINVGDNVLIYSGSTLEISETTLNVFDYLYASGTSALFSSDESNINFTNTNYTGTYRIRSIQNSTIEIVDSTVESANDFDYRAVYSSAGNLFISGSTFNHFKRGIYHYGAGDIDIGGAGEEYNYFPHTIEYGLYITGAQSNSIFRIRNNVFDLDVINNDNPTLLVDYAIYVTNSLSSSSDLLIESNIINVVGGPLVYWNDGIRLNNNANNVILRWNYSLGTIEHGIYVLGNGSVSGSTSLEGNIAGGFALAEVGIYLEDEDDAELTSNWTWNFETADSKGIWVKDSTGVTVTGNLGDGYPDIWDCYKGIVAEDSPETTITTVDINMLDAGTYYGITVDGSSDSEVTYNEIGFANYGIAFMDSPNGTANFNTIGGTARNTYSISFIDSSYGEANDNQISDSAEYAIRVLGQAMSYLTGMTILDNTFSEVEGGVYALYVDDLVIGSDSTGNSMANSAGATKNFGVFVEHGSDVFIYDNDIEGFTEGIDLVHVTQFKIFRNDIENTTFGASKGIYITDSSSTSSYAVVCNEITVNKNGIVNRPPEEEDADNFVAGGMGLGNKISVYHDPREEDNGTHLFLHPNDDYPFCQYYSNRWMAEYNWSSWLTPQTGVDPNRGGVCMWFIDDDPYYTGSFNPATMQSLCGIVE